MWKGHLEGDGKLVDLGKFTSNEFLDARSNANVAAQRAGTWARVPIKDFTKSPPSADHGRGGAPGKRPPSTVEQIFERLLGVSQACGPRPRLVEPVSAECMMFVPRVAALSANVTKARAPS
jgi:hypothetical protein